MLALSRKVGEEILIGDNVLVRVVKVRGDRVTLAFDAPKEIPIKRTELLKKEPKDVGRGV